MWKIKKCSAAHRKKNETRKVKGIEATARKKCVKKKWEREKITKNLKCGSFTFLLEQVLCLKTKQ